MTPCDVALIGCGPTGAFLANLLGARGVSVRVFEKQPSPYDLPRAVHFDGEAMRLLQSAGLADQMRQRTRVNPGMLFKDTNGTVLVDWSRDQNVGLMGWHESYRFHQPDMEETLRAGLWRYSNVHLHSGVEVTGVDQTDADVTLQTTDGPVQARYAVACDGATSRIRDRLGITFEDLGFEERWLVVDLALTRPRPDLGDHSIQFCDLDAPATYVRGVGTRRRFEIRLDGPAPDDVWPLMARWITPQDADLERAAVYSFRSRLATQWQVGRVFLAGDAAHQMPPFMGQGLCAGLRDAANLAWKLAAVLGSAHPHLLSTYATERAPNARAFIALSADLGRLINQTATGHAPADRMRSIWPDLGPGLGVRDGVTGALAPQLDRADDAAPTGFYILARAPLSSELPQIIGHEDWLSERGLYGVILRPDGYVLAAGRTAAQLQDAVNTHNDLIRTVPPRHGFPALTETP